MKSEVIFTSQYIEITKRPDGYYIESFNKGMSIEQLNQFLSEHTEIGVNSFAAIKNALLFPPKPPAKFAILREKIKIETTQDELKAYLSLNVNEQELLSEKKISLIKEILLKLQESGIVFGIKKEVILNELCAGKPILVAEGIPPVKGEDSIVRMYELKEAKPELKEDGNVDHYELNLINLVSAGDWLGERLEPTEGTPGKSVKGNTVLPVSGKQYPLLYDRKSVKEVKESNITKLYASRSGAVHYEGDRISVSNYLEITNNVDFKTGNIDFDGFLTVKGSVEDNFSVVADKDIEILGDYGIGSVKDIESREGSIYIKGGIAGKNKAIITSKKDIFTKFVSDATIYCEGSVHIGTYCLNSNITAQEVILDSPKGQIIGGAIQAQIRVVAAVVGSPWEKRTLISVAGFDRLKLKERLQNIAKMIEDLRKQLTKAKQDIARYSQSSSLTAFQAKEYEDAKELFYDVRSDIKILEEEKKKLISYLKARGEGEIVISKNVFVNTYIEIKGITKEIRNPILSPTFYVIDGELKED